MQFSPNTYVLVIVGRPQSCSKNENFNHWLTHNIFVAEVVTAQNDHLCVRHIENSSLVDDSLVDLRWINLTTEDVDVLPMENNIHSDSTGCMPQASSVYA